MSVCGYTYVDQLCNKEGIEAEEVLVLQARSNLKPQQMFAMA